MNIEDTIEILQNIASNGTYNPNNKGGIEGLYAEIQRIEDAYIKAQAQIKKLDYLMKMLEGNVESAVSTVVNIDEDEANCLQHNLENLRRQRLNIDTDTKIR